MTKFGILSLTLITMISPVNAWVVTPIVRNYRPTTTLKIQIPDDDDVNSEAHDLLNQETNPCWSDMASLDDDCVLGSVYASNFVASEWIRDMPCAEGIEDCDVPQALKNPGASVESVDVMDFLGLKRADSLKPASQ
eukprot:CAMPEP_0194303562 /NCGR_PEP_ID=MMETSP0171-20130528/1415_1 /TAXON_ID=218684 /ORGANISM="Corethron pennatum, Strain L29A3" /LENGTH=135 /DNA_ID=CAMNT_0039054507 /DNA_START=66 /DNA_END=473 /DNA_ORIENTATION=-